MSYIPDIRAEIEEPLYKGTKGSFEPRENPYYQGLLNEEGANYVVGFDYAVEQVAEDFLYNLNLYQDELEECGFDDVRLNKFEGHFSDFLEREFTDAPLDLDTITDTQIRLILTLFRAFSDYSEMVRDEIGVSLIEGMTEEEQEQCRAKFKEGYKNYLLRLESEEA